MRTRGRGGRMLFDEGRLNSYTDLLMGNTNHLLESDSDRSDSRDVVDKEDEVHAREDNLPCMSEQQIQDDSNDKDTIEHDEKGREILVIDGKCFVSVAAPRVMLEDLREEQVFKIWKSYFSRTMSGEMRRIRVAAGSRSVPPPAWMRQDLWEGLWDIWETRKYKILQNQNRRNRLSDRDGLGVVKSTAGTISISHHAHRLALKNGGKSVSFQEVFDRTHRRNKGKGLFVDQKSKKISETYATKLKEKQSQSNGASSSEGSQGSYVYDSEVWAEASGGPRNGRCYGFGNSYSGNVSYYSHSLGTISSQVEMEQYKKRIQELERQQRELQEMNSNFDQKVQNVVSSVLAAYGIFPGQHAPGQCINPGISFFCSTT
ncbi:UNVERIFIED_CONTAM: hypothetical protein Sradi_3822300 [Sesamum radiatum]|uniref:Uncharacterized protein n=1 Tax=Sesamum radiatum TaxID=300843 RepID=A0AAW2Q0V3_SESRA